MQINISPMLSGAQEQACAEMMAASDPWQTLGFDLPAALRIVCASDRERYVAHVDGRLAGLLLLNLHGTFAGYIQIIGIAPEFRGQGCGSALLGFAEERIFRDLHNVFLCVSSFNHAARRLYARRGYAEVGELTDFLVAGHSEFLLRKTRGPKHPGRAAPVLR